MKRENLDEIAADIGPLVMDQFADDSYFGIACGDALPRAESRDDEDLEKEVEDIMGSNRWGGVMVPLSMTCAQWPFEAKERKTVDEEVETANPVLIVGNTYDPATAMDNAYELSKLFPGSAVIEQQGFGVSFFLIPPSPNTPLSPP